MTYLIKLIFICYILTLSKINAQGNDILNNKIIFKINNNVYTTVDFKIRKNYLELLNSSRIPDSETKNIQDDFISGLLFLEYYQNNEFDINNFEKQISDIYNDKFKKYDLANELQLEILEKEIINQNIKIDLIRQKTIEQILNSKRDEIFENTNELDLLYNFNIKYLTAKKDSLNQINIKNIKNRSDLLNLEKKLINNNINFLIKEKNINNIDKILGELKLIINSDKRILIKDKNNLITIFSLEKRFESYENIFVTLVNVKQNNKIENKNLNCNFINQLENKKSFKEYKYSDLNKQIKENLFKVNDFILIKNNDIYDYIFLCEMRFDKKILNTININKKIESLAKNIEENFIKKYFKIYKVEILNE